MKERVRAEAGRTDARRCSARARWRAKVMLRHKRPRGATVERKRRGQKPPSSSRTHSSEAERPLVVASRPPPAAADRPAQLEPAFSRTRSSPAHAHTTARPPLFTPPPTRRLSHRPAEPLLIPPRDRPHDHRQPIHRARATRHDRQSARSTSSLAPPRVGAEPRLVLTERARLEMEFAVRTREPTEDGVELPFGDFCLRCVLSPPLPACRGAAAAEILASSEPRTES